MPASGVGMPAYSVPTSAYYSFWFRFKEPFAKDPAWYMLQQWKTAGKQAGWSDPVWSVNPVRDLDGRHRLSLWCFVGSNGKYNADGNGFSGVSAQTFNPTAWNHVETYYKHARDKTGEITVWLNGTLAISRTNVITEYSYPIPSGWDWRQYSVNAYGENLSPNPHTLYIDDCAISSLRIGN